MRVFIPSLAHSLTHSLTPVPSVRCDTGHTEDSEANRALRDSQGGKAASKGNAGQFGRWKQKNSQRMEGQRGHVGKPGSTDWTACHPCPAGHRGRCWGGWHGDRAGCSCEGVKTRERKVWMKNEDCMEGSGRHPTDDTGPQKQGPECQNREGGHHSLNNRATEGF